MITWQRNTDDERDSIVAVIDGEIYLADDRHPRFSLIVDELETYDIDLNRGALSEDDIANYDDEIIAIFEAKHAIERVFMQVSDRVTLAGNTLFFDGDAVDNALTQHVLQAINNGGVTDAIPFIAFWEKVATNPNEHSRENLFRWLMADAFAITESGDIVGYKGVSGDFESLWKGNGIVNGVEVINSALDNTPGNVVSMPRSAVQHDPGTGCSTGLHVGTWDYARTYGSKMIEVHVNPRDVVSVPTEAQDQKMRVSLYTVVRELTSRYDEAVVKDEPIAPVMPTRDAQGRFLRADGTSNGPKANVLPKRDAKGHFIKNV